MTDAPAPSDFERLFALIALVVDAKVCKARIEELREATEASTQAAATLAAQRAMHEAALARDRADLERERQELRQREVKVAAAEAANRHERGLLVKAAAERNLDGRFERLLGGGTRLKEEYAGG